MNLFKKVLLYLSAFIPLYVLLIIKIAIELINNNISVNVLNSVMLSFLCVLVSLGLVGLYIAISSGRKAQIYVLSAQNLTEKHFLGYFSLFVLFALTFQIELICMAVVFVLIILMIGVVYVKNNLFYINPFLNIIGYSFYELEYKKEDDETVYKNILLCYGKLDAGSLCLASVTSFNFNMIKK